MTPTESIDLLDRARRGVRRALPRGERPSLQEYIDRHPELADEIRELFPALVEMEQVKADATARRGAPTAAAGGPRRPEQLGDFRILREVGRGGMGVVYEAEQVSLGRHVALKVLPRRCSATPRRGGGSSARRRRRRGCTTPTSCPVFGVGEHEGTAYYVMQFIQGLGLDAVLDELKRLRHARRRTPDPSGRRAEAPAASRRAARDRPAADVARSLVTGRFDADRAGDTDRGPAPRPTAPDPPTEHRPTDPTPGRRAVGRRARGIASSAALSGPRPTSAGRVEAADLLAERGPDRRAGGRRAGLRPQPGDRPPRHQAVEPAAGRRRASSG